MKQRTQERGNILFLILLAVVLFAALSYVVTSSMRGEGKSASSESASANAASILQFATLVENTVSRMRLTDNVQEHQISFQTKVFRRWRSELNYFDVVNPNCTNSDCLVYKSVGGSVPEVTFDNITTPITLSYSTTHPYHGHALASRTKVAGVGTDKEDLILFMTGLSKGQCDAINSQLGLPSTMSTFSTGWAAWGVGPYSSSGTNNYWSFDDTTYPGGTIGTAGSVVYGRHAACVIFNAFGYSLYYVLLAR